MVRRAKRYPGALLGALLALSLGMGAVLFIAQPALAGPASPRPASTLPPFSIFLSAILKNWPAAAGELRVNIPYFDVADAGSQFSQLAIFWFGQVTPASNYADVRVGYGNNELYIYLAVFDRRLWSNLHPTPATLTAWDSVSLYLQTDPADASALNSNNYRFDAGLYNAAGGPLAGYTAAYRGSPSGWTAAATPFTAIPGWRGNAMNDNVDDRGWTLAYRLPFTSTFGLASRPAEGTLWRLGLAVHDRDDQAGTLIPDQVWPPNLDVTAPATWGQLRFGLPMFTPPATPVAGVTTVRQGLNGASVPDAPLGGTTGNLCNADPGFWTNWGSQNFAGALTFNIQNEADISDWPCFAKYYVTFPLDHVPADKIVISATLTLHQWGNSGSLDVEQPSLIQVLSVAGDWDPATITWNNAPLAVENVSQAWVPAEDCGDPFVWPCAARTWDVSRAAAQAYSAGQPLRLVLYCADAGYSNGKFFTTSGTQDWNATGRPTLQVAWGNP